MAKITYTDHERAAPYVTFHGVEFQNGIAVEVDEDREELLKAAEGNRFFAVERGEAKRGPGRPRKIDGGEPEPT